MSLFTRPRVDDPTALTPAERRARADALREQITATLRVTPPSDGDVPAGCALCGLGHVEVPGSRTFSFLRRRTVRADSPSDTGVYVQVGDDGRQRWVVDVDTTTETPARDLPRDVLARLVWSRVHVSRRALDVVGGGTVTIHLCPACQATRDEHRLTFGRSLVERLLVDAGWTFRPGEELATVRNVAYAAITLDARRRGRAEPAPNAIPWEHLPRTIRRADDLPAPGETIDSRFGRLAATR